MSEAVAAAVPDQGIKLGRKSLISHPRGREGKALDIFHLQGHPG
jgi:hypothetical protein